MYQELEISEKVVNFLKKKLNECQVKEELKNTIIFSEYIEKFKKAFLKRKRRRKCTRKKKAK